MLFSAYIRDIIRIYTIQLYLHKLHLFRVLKSTLPKYVVFYIHVKLPRLISVGMNAGSVYNI